MPPGINVVIPAHLLSVAASGIFSSSSLHFSKPHTFLICFFGPFSLLGAFGALWHVGICVLREIRVQTQYSPYTPGPAGPARDASEGKSTRREDFNLYLRIKFIFII